MSAGPDQAWSHVAQRYSEYWSPRLRPYIERLVEVFEPAPEGPIAIPGCGPGDEVLLAEKRWADRSIIATDPAQGMISILWKRLREAGSTRAVASVGPAGHLSAFVRQAAGVLSSFTLQLLPNPIAALADWSRCLRAEGKVAALFWPHPPPETVHGRLHAALEASTGEKRLEWEAPTREELPHLGFHLLSEETVAFEIEHSSPEEFFDELVHSGPLHALEQRLGKPVLERCRAQWITNTGFEAKGGGVVHRPPARIWILARGEGQQGHAAGPIQEGLPK